MKNEADYSLYKCPYSHLEKSCGHELHGPEGFADTYGVWCECGFRGPVFYLDPVDLRLEKKGAPQDDVEAKTEQHTTDKGTPLCASGCGRPVDEDGLSCGCTY